MQGIGLKVMITLRHNENVPRKAPDPEAEKLFQMLAEEAEDDKE
jgi:hypothetical protein